MERIPVHIVTGAPGSGKSALIARLVAADSHWLGLVNRLPDGAQRNLRQLSPGCPCCTGRVVLQIMLARALRQTGATRAFVELADADHAGTLEKLLAESPWNLSMRSARSIVLPHDLAITASEFA